MKSEYPGDLRYELNLDELSEEATRIAERLLVRATELTKLLSRSHRLIGQVLRTMVMLEVELCEKFLKELEIARNGRQPRELAIVLDDACWFFELDGQCARFKQRMLQAILRGGGHQRITKPQVLEFFKDAVLPVFDRKCRIGKKECLRRLSQFRKEILFWDGQNRPHLQLLATELVVDEQRFHVVWPHKRGRCNDAPCDS